MKISSFALSLGLGVAANIGMGAESDTSIRPPNIVYFLVDDMGWQDTSEPFWKEKTPLNNFFHTPNMERLASQGMKFTSAYACAVCSPSRVSLMTGMNAARHRVTNWTLPKDRRTDNLKIKRGIDLPMWNVNGVISPDYPKQVPHTVRAKCLPEFLREAGYETIISGKAHFGAIGTPGADPKHHGFTVNIAGHAGGGVASYSGLRNFGYDPETGMPRSPQAVPGLEAYWGKDISVTEALTIEAIKAVDSVVNADKPFFLYLSHHAVHTPIQADKRFVAKYRKAGVPQVEAAYASMVEAMDKSLGDVMDYLDSRKLRDNTVIIFMSDNGGLSDHERGGKRQTHNLPLAAGKGSIREGGIREPMMICWPGKIAARSVCDTPTLIEDTFPTVLEIAGISADKIPASQRDGVSYLPLAMGGNVERKQPMVWHYPNSWNTSRDSGYGAYSAIREGDYKYVFYHEPMSSVREELFNIRTDIGETENLVSKEPVRKRELARKLAAYLKSVDAQMPVETATKKRVEIPTN